MYQNKYMLVKIVAIKINCIQINKLLISYNYINIQTNKTV